MTRVAVSALVGDMAHHPCQELEGSEPLPAGWALIIYMIDIDIYM